MELSRRNFLKLSAPAAGALVVGKLPSARLSAASSNDVAMLYDASKCVGCRACQTACRRWHKLPEESIGFQSLYDNPADLSADTLTVIKAKKYGADGSERLLLCKYQCMHCTDAACAKVCPTGALKHHNLGFVGYDSDKCSGCGYCSQFCPFGVPRLSGNALTGRQKMNKCDFCPDRVAKGQATACAAACPTGALTFGERGELLAAGRQRAELLRTTNHSAALYGESQVGGLHVMYVLKEPPGVYEFPTDPKVPKAASAWQDIIQPVGAGLMGAVILGLAGNYAIARAKIRKQQ